MTKFEEMAQELVASGEWFETGVEIGEDADGCYDMEMFIAVEDGVYYFAGLGVEVVEFVPAEEEDPDERYEEWF